MKCKHCKADITLKDGVWVDNFYGLPQYCAQPKLDRKDLKHAQKHEPEEEVSLPTPVFADVTNKEN